MAIYRDRPSDDTSHPEEGCLGYGRGVLILFATLVLIGWALLDVAERSAVKAFVSRTATRVVRSLLEDDRPTPTALEDSVAGEVALPAVPETPSRPHPAEMPQEEKTILEAALKKAAENTRP